MPASMAVSDDAERLAALRSQFDHEAPGTPKITPLYGLEALAEAPQAPVLLVQGAKCAAAARAALGASYCVLAWGDYARTDLSPLDGRQVTIWPTHTDAGRRAAAAIAGRIGSKATLSIAPPQADAPEGYSAATPGVDIVAHLVAQSAPMNLPEPRRITRAQPQRATGDVVDSDTGHVTPSAFAEWERLGLAQSKAGPYPTADNVERIIRGTHGDRLYFDSFRMRKLLILEDGLEREWTDSDTLSAFIWIQRDLGLQKMQIGAVRHGIDAAAFRRQRNSLTTWLDSLEWDGIERLSSFLVDVFHCAPSDYASAVGRCWLVSMVARAYKPGCQVDTMVVLEGGQGTFKSSALAILGGDYYAALPAAFGTRDFLQALDGMWLVEIPDMSGFKGREIDHVKAIITTRRDRYRRAYGHDAETYPRQCVFAATSNGYEWNEDETGARRFWPARINGQVELDLLRSIRPQLLAEAVARFKRGEKWWDVPAEAAIAEQAERRPDDSWINRVEQVTQELLLKLPWNGPRTLTTAQVLEGIGVDIPKQGKAEQMRMGRVLSALGWTRRTSYVNSRAVKVWHAPGDPYLTTPARVDDPPFD